MSELYAVRRARLRDRCAATGSTAALISRPANVRYLTGCTPPGAALLLGPGDDVLLCGRPLTGDPTEGRPADDVRTSVLPARGGDPVVAAAGLAAKEGARTLAVEEISDQARGELLESSLGGRAERHLALELERRLVDHGADGPAFPTSVATGPNSGRAGHLPSDRRVEEGDFLTVNLGANYRGYRCEIGRTFVIGTTPADWQIDLYDLVFAAQKAGREALAPGVECHEVDRVARQILETAGHGDGLGPWTGHGVGLEIDEDPQLSPGAMGKLDACVPVTVEPGVHIPGRGGVRIDDTLVVRPEADGGPELLTITTKELLAL